MADTNIQLLYGDCFTLMQDIPNDSVDLILTDPPYLFNRGGGTTIGTDMNSPLGKSELYKFGNKLMSEMTDFDKPQIYKLLDESNRVLKIMRGYYFCNETALQYYLSWATEHNYKYSIIVLEKSPYVMNRNKYVANCEFLVRIVAKSGAGIKVLDYNQPSVINWWLYAVQPFHSPKNKLHPTEKPTDIIEGVLQLNTNERDLVLDPFMGSGTVGVVCKYLNRKYIGIEIDEKYYSIANDRISNSTIVHKLF